MHLGAEILDGTLIEIEDGVLKSPQALAFLAALILVEMHVFTATARAFDGFGKAETHNGFPLVHDECQKTDDE
jgi:hypothetical protein